MHLDLLALSTAVSTDVEPPEALARCQCHMRSRTLTPYVMTADCIVDLLLEVLRAVPASLEWHLRLQPLLHLRLQKGTGSMVKVLSSTLPGSAYLSSYNLLAVY